MAKAIHTHLLWMQECGRLTAGGIGHGLLTMSKQRGTTDEEVQTEIKTLLIAGNGDSGEREREEREREREG